MLFPAARRRVLLAAVLGLSALPQHGGAVQVRPGSPLAPPPAQGVRTEPMTASPRWADARFELLISVRALTDVLERDAGAGRLGPDERRAAQQALQGLREQPTLTAAQAQTRLEALQAALGASGRLALQGARRRLEERAHLQLSSSRFARGEDAPGLATFRLALLVPGGGATVRAVQRGAAHNPFGQGVPAAALQTLLRLLA